MAVLSTPDGDPSGLSMFSPLAPVSPECPPSPLICRGPGVSWTLTRGWPAVEILIEITPHKPALDCRECDASPLMSQHRPPIEVWAICLVQTRWPRLLDVPLNVLTQTDCHLTITVILAEAGHFECRVITPCVLITLVLKHYQEKKKFLYNGTGVPVFLRPVS